MTVKPQGCPFCGRIPEVQQGGPANLTWYVVCARTSGHIAEIQNNGTRKEAIELWNQAGTFSKRESK